MIDKVQESIEKKFQQAYTITCQLSKLFYYSTSSSHLIIVSIEVTQRQKSNKNLHCEVLENCKKKSKFRIAGSSSSSQSLNGHWYFLVYDLLYK